MHWTLLFLLKSKQIEVWFKKLILYLLLYIELRAR